METKNISITGINNKYQIKKLISEKKAEKQRDVIQIWNIKDEYYDFSKQKEVIGIIHFCIQHKEEIYEDYRIFVKEIERKISNYRQQDLLKSILNPEKIITISFILDRIVECNLECYYCNSKMLILYKNVREPKQWTVDRINNYNGHNVDNIVLSCLECNLKRRSKNKDSFLFTKQLKIVRENFTEDKLVNNIL
jgi:hypothetical protein